jgi:antagonist of KipI
LSDSTLRRLAATDPIRLTRGAQAHGFVPQAFEALLGENISVSASSDRMGLRLAGVRLDPPGDGRMPSEGVPLGAIQVPPGGEPLLLFVDHQTTGGYPVLAAVVRADLWRVGQLRPGERVRFALVPMREAQRLAREQEAWLRSHGVVAVD